MKVIGDVRSIGNSIMIQALNNPELIEDGRYTVELKKYRKGRSLDQNAYFWALVGEITKKENGWLADSDNLYAHLLEMAGAKYEVLYIEEKALNRLKEFGIIRHVAIKRREMLNNQMMVTALIFYGSSKFDTKEMSDLIDTTLRYASEVGVENVDSYWKGVLDV